MSTKDEGVQVSAGDPDSFAEMRKAQLADQQVEQAAVKATLPKGEIKDMPDDTGQVVGLHGRPVPEFTRGQLAKQASAERKARIQAASAPAVVEAEPAPVAAPAAKKAAKPAAKKAAKPVAEKPAAKKAVVKKAEKPAVKKVATKKKTAIKKK